MYPLLGRRNVTRQPTSYVQSQIAQHVSTITESLTWQPKANSWRSVERDAFWVADPDAEAFCAMNQSGERRVLRRTVNVIGSFMLHKTPNRTMQYMLGSAGLLTARQLEGDPARSATAALADFIETGDPNVTQENQAEVLQLLAHAACKPWIVHDGFPSLEQLQAKLSETE